MRKFLLLIFVISTSTCFSQSISRYVVSSGGNYSSNSSGVLYSSIGEIAVSTFIGVNNILTEGFVQPPPPLNTEIQSIKLTTGDFNIFPNPTSNNIHITTGTTSKLLSLEIFDSQGRKVKNYSDFQKTSDTSYFLNITSLDDGVYFIKVFDSSIESGFKVIRLIKI